ncbi:hypothetical protein K443DRAFT_8249 [Laccaria amethystina LaAM-08-1]|uniref:Uncharacterized protein n=1 Tax=Laccaria amethystina LaAM-08-1 TaxID=1095629 RepID=A0A0C9XUS4_9AGAR|nr:hypothetical protein K443DRAFT_8249 [Laccaria amethystina LaAM-08-1]
MANVAKYVEDYEAALKKQALWEEKKKKAAKAKAAKKKGVKGKGRHIESSSEESGEFKDDDDTTGEPAVQQKDPRRPVPKPRRVRPQPAAEEQAVEAETEVDAPAEHEPSTSNVQVNIPALSTTGVVLPNAEPPPAPRYTLQTRRGG